MSGSREVTDKTGSGKRLPIFKSDEEAEAFLEQDVSDYLWAGDLAPFPFEFRPEVTGEDAPKRIAVKKPHRRSSR